MTADPQECILGDPGMIPGDDGPKGDEAALGPFAAELADDMKSFKDKPRMIQILDGTVYLSGKDIGAGTWMDNTSFDH